MASQDWFEKDFYAILGVPHDADAAAIKKAYRRLARKEHPDHNPGDTAAEQRFKDIGEAYAVLADPEERKQYDALRSMAHGGARFTAGGPGGASGAGFEDVFSQMFGDGAGGGGTRVRFGRGRPGGYPGGAGAPPGAGEPDLEDLLGGMFGQGGFSGYGAPRGPRKGRDLEARTTLSFRDAVEGATVTLTTSEGDRITTRIPAGVRDGQKIRVKGKGAPGDAGSPSGDLYLTVSVAAHPAFGRDGRNLTVDLPVTFAEAALGATVKVPTLTGDPVTVRIPPGTPSGRVLRVRGRGVPAKAGTGDLLARVAVVVPQRLTDEARSAVEALSAQESGVDPRAELFARARE